MVNLTNTEPMMRKTYSLAEAKAHFAECVRQTEDGEPVLITRYGKPVAALVPAAALADLDRLHAGAEKGLAGLAGRWKDGDDIDEVLQRIARTRGRSRRVP